MNHQPKRAKPAHTGFTIIEVLIVVGIASAIMMIVIVAVSQLQRNQRDTQRKNYAFRLNAAMREFYGNNRRYPNPSTPGDVQRFAENYAPTDADPSTGLRYSLTSIDGSLSENTLVYRGLHESHSDIPPVGTVYIQYGHWCNKPGAPASDSPDDPIAGDDESPTNFAIWIGTETGSFFCVDNFIAD
jgi:prepilin-type N-terminal cleavage/methylation domain-containing protein